MVVLYREPVSTGTRLAGWAFFLFFVAVSAGCVWVALQGEWATLGSLIVSIPMALAGLRFAIGTLTWRIEGSDLVRVGMMGSVPTFPVRFPLSELEAVTVERDAALGAWIVTLTGPGGTQAAASKKREEAEEIAGVFARGLDLPFRSASPSEG